MNKFFVSALAATGLVAAAATTQASTLTYQLLTTTPYTMTSGVAPSTGDSTLVDNFLPTYTGPDKVYAVPTNLNVGSDNTLPGLGTANDSATWNNVPISLQFVIYLGTGTGGPSETFTVDGAINGTVGYDGSDNPYSTAKVTYTSISAPGATIDLTSMDPSTNVSALEATVSIGGTPVSVWIDTIQQKAAPGESVIHTGYLSTPPTTPEPGSVAMIVGMGVSGGLFLRRKRRA